MDDVIALRDALLEDILDAEFGRADLRAFRANLDALIAAVEARAAGSLVERVETEPCHATMLCPYPKGHPIHADEGEHEYRPTPPPAGATQVLEHATDSTPPPAVDGTRCIFAGCVATWRHWHGGFPGGYTNPADPDGPPIQFTDPDPDPDAVRDDNGAALTRPTPPPAVDGTRVECKPGCDSCRKNASGRGLTPPATDTDRCPVDGCDDLPEDHYHPDTDRLRALEAALDHAEKNLGVIALTLTDHPEYPVKAADVDAARALARFTAQDIRAARALLAPDGERSE